MKQIRKRLTYANVMSSLAVFLVLGGASAFAAAQLGKNTVGTKQLKKNAVTAAKIKNNAVNGAKVNEGSLGAVPNATHATSADKATAADKATTATSAANAADAAKLGGQLPDAYQSRVRWALVNSAANGDVGEILAQSGGVSVAAGLAGFSYLDWGENIGGRAIQVSIAQINEGFITATPCGANEAPADTTCAPTGTNNPNHTIVRMDSAGGAATNQTYFISITK